MTAACGLPRWYPARDRLAIARSRSPCRSTVRTTHNVAQHRSAADQPLFWVATQSVDAQISRASRRKPAGRPGLHARIARQGRSVVLRPAAYDPRNPAFCRPHARCARWRRLQNHAALAEQGQLPRSGGLSGLICPADAPICVIRMNCSD